MPYISNTINKVETKKLKPFDLIKQDSLDPELALKEFEE
jgi:hypothetical protein